MHRLNVELERFFVLSLASGVWGQRKVPQLKALDVRSTDFVCECYVLSWERGNVYMAVSINRGAPIQTPKC